MELHIFLYVEKHTKLSKQTKLLVCLERSDTQYDKGTWDQLLYIQLNKFGTPKHFLHLIQSEQIHVPDDVL